MYIIVLHSSLNFRCPQIFLKSRSLLKILGARMAIRNSTRRIHMLGASLQNLVVRVTRCPRVCAPLINSHFRHISSRQDDRRLPQLRDTSLQFSFPLLLSFYFSIYNSLHSKFSCKNWNLLSKKSYVTPVTSSHSSSFMHRN